MINFNVKADISLYKLTEDNGDLLYYEISNYDIENRKLEYYRCKTVDELRAKVDEIIREQLNG